MPDEIVFNISETMYQQLIDFQETLNETNVETKNAEPIERESSLFVSEEIEQNASSINSETPNHLVD